VVPPRLSHAEQDALVLSLQATVEELRATITVLQTTISEQREMITQLQAKLGANSTNSNRPPSSDGLKKGQPKSRSLRQRSGKKPGGQLDHPGTTLAWSEIPDEIVVHTLPAQCDACDAPLLGPISFASRQVFDIAEPRYVVTEHRAAEVQCVCGKLHRREFPAGVNAPMQYGPNIEGIAVYLTQHHMLPVLRTSDLITDFFGLSFSAASVQQAVTDAAERLAPTVDAIADALRGVPVAHADETGMRVDSKLHWMHTLATPLLTWVGIHQKRGCEAMEDFDILPHFRGTLVHDGLESYRGFDDCIHSLCNAHHLRELKALAEDSKQPWIQKMSNLLQSACHEVNINNDGRLSQDRIKDYRSRYQKIIRIGERANPVRASYWKRGRTKQSSATNLLRRLRKYADDVWRFSVDPAVPFTNNLAEQAIRMLKVKQKISGCFRSEQGASRFCIIRTYFETMRKQGCNILKTLTQALQGEIPQPRFT
jgi:transposase